MKITELKEKNINIDQIQEDLINNNCLYMAAAIIIKEYTNNKHGVTRINQRLVDAAYKAAYNNYDYLMEYKDFDEIKEEFEELYTKNQLLYYVMEETYIKDRHIDGFIPFYDKETRYNRIKEIIKYPIEYIRKGYFLNLIYENYFRYGITISTEYFLLDDDEELQNWYNDNLYKSYYDDYDDFSIDSIHEFISNCQYDDYYKHVPDNTSITGITQEINYVKDRYIEFLNNGMIELCNPLTIKILELKDVI